FWPTSPGRLSADATVVIPFAPTRAGPSAPLRSGEDLVRRAQRDVCDLPVGDRHRPLVRHAGAPRLDGDAQLVAGRPFDWVGEHVDHLEAALRERAAHPAVQAALVVAGVLGARALLVDADADVAEDDLEPGEAVEQW